MPPASPWAAPPPLPPCCSAAKIRSLSRPNVDCGDHVIIINCDQAVLTGSKLDKKYYYHHSGWIGGMKAVQYRTLMAEKSDKAMMLAVKGMLPGNTLGAAALKRLRVYKGAEHNNAAQKPEAYTL